MVICPIAITVGCKKCPVFKVCPLTTVIGDQKTPAAADAKPAAKPATKPAKKTTPASKKKR
ncbi:MAG: hypothetical protein IPP88_01430 [Betaproteobacteria bacterium]|jgi:hypothetical protein|nr:hypothetical protein [Betaproteobacteria bacterium]